MVTGVCGGNAANQHRTVRPNMIDETTTTVCGCGNDLREAPGCHKRLQFTSQTSLWWQLGGQVYIEVPSTIVRICSMRSLKIISLC